MSDLLHAALEEIVSLLASPRRRSPVEARLEHTNGYAGFIIACGFARLGDRTRARALFAEWRHAFAYDRLDPVHAYLGGAFAARLEQACAGLPRDAALPEELRAELDALDRIPRYKVGRLRAASPTLATDFQIGGGDPHEEFKQRGPLVDPAHDPEVATLRAIADPAARSVAIDQALAGTTDARVIERCLRALRELPAASALPVLSGAIARWRTTAVHDWSRALSVAARFGDADLAREILPALVVTPANLLTTLRALRRLAMPVEMASIVASCAAADLETELALEGARAYLGEHPQEVFASARKQLERVPMIGLELARTIATAAAIAPVSRALDELRALAPFWRNVSDSFGTNSHYCLAALHFVESLVLGISDVRVAEGTDEPPWDFAIV